MEDVKSHLKYKVFDSLKPFSPDADCAKRMIEESTISPNVWDEFGCPLLIKAVEYDNQEIIELLLNKGAHVNCRESETGATPLHYAVLRPTSLLIAKILVKYRADVNSVDYNGSTPFDWSYQNISNDDRAYDRCEFLIKKGANVSTFKRAILKIRKFLRAC